MKIVRFCLALALAGVSFVSPCQAQGFADAFISYNPGIGFAAGFTNPGVALGQPTTTANPFNPAFRNTQLVSLGAGGSLTVQFNTPIPNNPVNPFGRDFIIFGNAGFIITNGDFSGGGITDGSLFGNNTGATRVWVSADNLAYYQLNPSLAPVVDGLFPTDAAGNFHLAVDPAFGQGDFNGQNLAGIRSLYNGSAGGSSFDISWAQDSLGNSVFLDAISFIRVDVLSGKSEIDGFGVALVPEPRTWALFVPGLALLRIRRRRRVDPTPRLRLKWSFMPMTARIIAVLCLCATFVRGDTFTETFATDPASRWQIFGNSNLFHWNSTNQNLEVKWDSAQPNSYFYQPLGTILARDDDFSLSFDLYLNDIVSGNESNKTGPLEIAIGFLNSDVAKSTNFKRGVYYPFGAPDGALNLVEFDYFPAGYYDFGGGFIFDVLPTITPTFISTGGNAFAPTVFAPYEFEFPSNLTVHVAMTYTASNQTLVTQLQTNGQTYLQLPDVVLTDTNSSSFTNNADFRVDMLSISSYSSAGDDFDSVLANGTVDNLVIVTPPPPVGNLTGAFSNNTWQVQFNSRSNWLYVLERTADLQSWSPASAVTPGNAAVLTLADSNSPAGNKFYHVRAYRP